MRGYHEGEVERKRDAELAGHDLFEVPDERQVKEEGPAGGGDKDRGDVERVIEQVLTEVGHGQRPLTALVLEDHLQAQVEAHVGQEAEGVLELRGQGLVEVDARCHPDYDGRDLGEES